MQDPRELEQDALQSLDAELAVLGGLMEHQLDAFEHAATLEPEHFTDDVHRGCMAAIKTLVAEGINPDAVAVKARIRSQVSDFEFLENLLATALVNAPAAGALGPFCDIVRELAQKRDLRTACREASQLANQSDVPYREALEAAQAAVMDATEAANPFKPSSIEMAIDASVKPVEELGGIRVHTGLHALDKLLGALESGTVTVVAGRPSMGKTVGASEIALNVALSQLAAYGDKAKAVAFFSLEMNARQLGARFNSSMACRYNQEDGPTYRDILEGGLTEGEMAKLRHGRENARGLPLQIYDVPKMTVPMMRAALRRLQMQRGLALVVIDYLQLVRPHKREQSREREVAQISGDIKEMALALKVPVVLLSQLNRGVEARDDKRPRLDDLRESGSIEQDADNVVMTYREAYYAQRQARPSAMEDIGEWTRAKSSDALEFIVAKNRNGPLGAAHQRCSVKHSRVMEKQTENAQEEML